MFPSPVSNFSLHRLPATGQSPCLVLGEINYDYLARAEHLPGPGEGIEGDLFIESPGGKAGNCAAALGRLGKPVAILARVGADWAGERALARLQNLGVDTRFVQRDSGAPTGVVLLHVDAQGEKQSLAVPGANRYFTVNDLPQEALKNTPVLVITMGVPPEVALEAARLAHMSGASVILDPAPARLVNDDLLRFITLIKPNAFETEVLTGIDPQDQARARRAALRLRERGAAAAAIQVESRGMLLAWDSGEAWLPHLPVDVVDTTGAGDAFAAGLAAGLLEGRDWAGAGRLASGLAALACRALGAQSSLPTRSELDDYLRQVGVE